MATTTVTSQHLNSTSRITMAAKAFVDAYFNFLEEKKKAALVGIPAVNSGTPPNDVVNYPLPGELAYLDRNKLNKLHQAADVIDAWLNADNATLSKKPLDALVEALP